MPERNKIVRKIHQQNENCCHFVLIRQQRFLEKARKNFWNGDVAAATSREAIAAAMASRDVAAATSPFQKFFGYFFTKK
jgi:hypothetical protein